MADFSADSVTRIETREDFERVFGQPPAEREQQRFVVEAVQFFMSGRYDDRPLGIVRVYPDRERTE